jgi:hypothetical protein
MHCQLKITKWAQTRMPISRTLLVVVSVFLVLLFAYDACFGERRDLEFSDGDRFARRWTGIDEFRLAVNVVPVARVDVTPAARVKETFAMFMPGNYKPMRDVTRPLASSAKPQG